MNNSMFKKLYYFCFGINIVLFVFSVLTFSFNGLVNIILFAINFILSLIIIISFMKRRKINNVNTAFPIIFIVFSVIVSIIAIIYSFRLFIPFMHINYYISFIFINYLMLNIYTMLSISK